MLWKAVTLLGLALCAQGERHATSEQVLKQEFVSEHGRHGELNHIGSHVPEHHVEYAWAYPSYEFSYSVNDPHTHDYKGQRENRHGDEVKGEYWLLQPDGKKRTVKYHSDKHKGFNAEVLYSEHQHQHQEEPRKEEIIKPVEEIVEEEPQRPIEESEPILVEEIPVAIVEEREEERIEPKHHKPKHNKPIHIEYYIQHKYRKHQEHEEHHKPERVEQQEERREEERREEEASVEGGQEGGQEAGQEARIQEEEELRKEIKHRKPVHVEYYSKIHHPIHKEQGRESLKPHYYQHIEELKEPERQRPVRVEEKIGKYRRVEEIRAERKHEPHVQLLRMHKPLLFRPEHAHHPRYHRDHTKQYKSQ